MHAQFFQGFSVIRNFGVLLDLVNAVVQFSHKPDGCQFKNLVKVVLTAAIVGIAETGIQQANMIVVVQRLGVDAEQIAEFTDVVIFYDCHGN